LLKYYKLYNDSEEARWDNVLYVEGSYPLRFKKDIVCFSARYDTDGSLH
jgi:hypothetical protein